MLTFTTAQWDQLIALYFWPFVRILAMFMADPVFGNRVIPNRVKVALAVFVSLAITPLLDPPPLIPPASAIGLWVLAQQILIGVAIGFSMRIVFAGIELAGSLIGLQMGLGFATFFDPMNAAQAPVVGQFFGILAVLFYFTFDGHLLTLATLAESFHLLPVQATPLKAVAWSMIAQSGGQIFLIGIVLSLPVVGVLLVSNVAIGIMTRAAPTLNLFAIGFPITLMVGMLMMYAALPYFVPVLDQTLHAGIEMILEMLHAMGGAP